MNNDVIVESDISDCLISVLKSSQHIGTVGPLFVYPNRKVQEAGAFVNDDGSVEMIGRNAPLPEGWLGQDQFVDYTSAACLAIRRDDFEKVGGFDYIFEPAYYEDVDLCLRLRALLGKRAVFTPKATVTHLEHQTATDPALGIDFSKVVYLNKIKFQSRWDLSIRSADDGFNLKQIEKSNVFSIFSTEHNSSKKLHIYSPFELAMGGGERYILTLASYLSEKYDVSLVFNKSYTQGRINQICRDLNISSLNISLCSLDESRKNYPNVLIIMDNSINPNIYPYGEKNILLCQFPIPRKDDDLRDTFKNLEPIRAIAAYSSFASEWVEKQLPNNCEPFISIIPPPITLCQNNLQNKDSSKILTIGRFFKGGHDKNLDFLAETLGNLNRESEHRQQMSLDIVGSVVYQAQGEEVISKILSMGDTNVRMHLNADGSVLQKLLHRSSIYWHAAGLKVDVEKYPQNCEHFGISPLEAMSAGTVPFVVNNGGPASYIQNGINGFLYETDEELVEKTGYFMSLDESKSLEIRENSRYTSRVFTKEKFAFKWDLLLSQL